MKKKLLIIHSTKTESGKELTPAEITRMHLVGRGWKHVGYSSVIHIDGCISSFPLIGYDPFDISKKLTGSDCIAVHVAYVGGQDKGKVKDTRTADQSSALHTMVSQLVNRFPDIKIAGHNQFEKVDCPGFDVPEWLKSIGIDSKNIFSKK